MQYKLKNKTLLKSSTLMLIYEIFKHCVYAWLTTRVLTNERYRQLLKTHWTFLPP